MASKEKIKKYLEEGFSDEIKLLYGRFVIALVQADTAAEKKTAKDVFSRGLANFKMGLDEAKKLV